MIICKYCNSPVYNPDVKYSRVNGLCYYHRKVQAGLIEPSEPVSERETYEDEIIERLMVKAKMKAEEAHRMISGPYKTIVTEQMFKSAASMAALETYYAHPDKVKDTLSYVDGSVKAAMHNELESHLYVYNRPNKSSYWNYLIKNGNKITILWEESGSDPDKFEKLMRTRFKNKWKDGTVELVLKRFPEFVQWSKTSRNVELDRSSMDENDTPRPQHDMFDIGGYDTPLDALLTKEKERILFEALSKIKLESDHIDRQIIVRRLLAEEPEGLASIGKSCGVSHVAILKREAKILNKLKEIMNYELGETEE